MRLNHASLTVSSLDRSIAFYRDLLGLELLGTLRRRAPWIAEMTGLPGADLRIAALGNPGADVVIELIEYVAPRGAGPRPIPTNDVGAAHLGFVVDDIDAACERLRAAGVRLLSEPVTVAEPPGSGRRAVYLRDPDGIPLELQQDAGW